MLYYNIPYILLHSRKFLIKILYLSVIAFTPKIIVRRMQANIIFCLHYLADVFTRIWAKYKFASQVAATA